MPVYVAATDRQAREEAEASTMHFFRAISQALRKGGLARQGVVAERLAEISYADVLREQAIYGSPEAVADRLLALREALGFSSLSDELRRPHPPRARARVDATLRRACHAAARLTRARDCPRLARITT
jgi:alkanesulfonate monooxygenase SsuD/methylene tetrahydromethanopterin reductase-like flavin-dependent oxidoreductase (luciferase family)